MDFRAEISRYLRAIYTDTWVIYMNNPSDSWLSTLPALNSQFETTRLTFMEHVFPFNLADRQETAPS